MSRANLFGVLVIATILFVGLSRTGEDKFIKDEVISGTISSKYIPTKYHFYLEDDNTHKVYRVWHNQYTFNGKYHTEKNDKVVIVKSLWKSGFWGDYFYKYEVKSYNGKPLTYTYGGSVYDIENTNLKN